MAELIKSQIMNSRAPINWDRWEHIVGLNSVKRIIKEVVVLPSLRKDFFTGLRRPPKAILLFGPPGTGKTLLGNCIASQCQSKLYKITPALLQLLTPQQVDDGAKMVRAIFASARSNQPSIIFIDEIDSLLSQRSDAEPEFSKRIKIELLVQLDQAATGEEDRVVVIGATNRPQVLDGTVRRKFAKRLYIPLPNKQARYEILKRMLYNERHTLTKRNFIDIAISTEGYSGADMKCLCGEAAMGPIRSIDISVIPYIPALRPITTADFGAALSRVRPSASPTDIENFVAWDRRYGSGPRSVIIKYSL